MFTATYTQVGLFFDIIGVIFLFQVGTRRGKRIGRWNGGFKPGHEGKKQEEEEIDADNLGIFLLVSGFTIQFLA